MSLPIQCEYCTEYFQYRILPEKRLDIGCICSPLEIEEVSQMLLNESDKEIASMLFHCLRVNPNERLSSQSFVNMFPLNL